MENDIAKISIVTLGTVLSTFAFSGFFVAGIIVSTVLDKVF